MGPCSARDAATTLPAWSLFPRTPYACANAAARRRLGARRRWPADLARVEDALRGRGRGPTTRSSARSPSHLVEAGGQAHPARPHALRRRTRPHGRRRPGAAPTAVTGAVAVELVHLGSLYHDDVIDEAETRRGVPSVNARWSNIVAILAGDFLLARGVGARGVARAPTSPGCSPTTIGELCRGQVLELQHLFDVDRSEEPLLLRDRAARPRRCSRRRAASAGWSPGSTAPTLDALTEFGRHLGMCFQIVDDVLDVTGTDASLGKPAGQRPPRGRLHAAGDLRARAAPGAARAARPQARRRAARRGARALARADGAVDAALDVARDAGRPRRQGARRRRRPRPRGHGGCAGSSTASSPATQLTPTLGAGQLRVAPATRHAERSSERELGGSGGSAARLVDGGVDAVDLGEEAQHRVVERRSAPRP